MVIKWSATAKPAAMSCLRRPVQWRASMAAETFQTGWRFSLRRL